MKKKKEKITYIDDGRSLADMSALSGGFNTKSNRPHTCVRDIWRTYWNATKMMVLPTLAAVGIIVVAYLIVLLLFSLA